MRALIEGIRRRRAGRTMAVGSAARVLALAGRAAGAERRGSVLILIVGALAMLSVVTLVYFAIGRGDRRTAEVAVQKGHVDEVIGKFQSYLSDDIIGADALAMYVDGYDSQLANSNPPAPALPNPDGAIRYREAMDYPSTDRQMQSAPQGNAPSTKFNPVGTYSGAWPASGTGDDDRRIPSDPWLADAEPTFLGSSSPTGSSLQPYVRPDWGHISNVAPSGNFVNLFNLRGNFDAPSGFQATGPNAQAITGGMSDNLLLTPTIGSLPAAPAANYAPPALSFGGQPKDNVPAHWDSLLLGAARPAVPGPYLPDNPRYPFYQWADADGDGVLDSKWFEMVDVSDPDGPLSLLPQDDRFRYVFAVRIVDLSGRVNLNTAGAFNTKDRADSRPSADYPAGLTPADVDLLHLLGLSDLYSRYGTAVGQQPGYNALESPANGPSNYAGYDDGATEDAGLLAYMALRKSLRELVVPGSIADLGNTSTMLDSAQDRYRWFANYAGQGDAAAYFSTGTAASAEFRRGGGFDNADLLELLTYNGTNDPSTLSRLEQAAGGASRTGQAGASNISFPNAQWNLSVLRDNRTAQFEREGLDNDENAGRGNGVLDDDAFVKAAIDPRQRLTTVSGRRDLAPGRIAPGSEATLDPASDDKIDAVEAILQATEPVVYGERNPGMLLRGYAEALMPHSWRTNYWQYTGGTADPTMRTLAYGHDPILAAWTTGHMVANMIDMFDRDGTSVATDKHMPTAFTMALVGDQTGLGAIDTASTGVTALYPFWVPRPSSAGGPRNHMDGTLDLDWALDLRETNSTQSGDQPSRLGEQSLLPTGMPPAVNIYGVEAQPFITEVGMLTIFTDARYVPGGGSTGGVEPMGGDEEWIAPVIQPPNPPQPAQDKPVTIDGHMLGHNRDFLCQVLAVQITNPFDSEIDLTGPTAGNYSTYYLEFGGNLYKLAEAQSDGSGATAIKLKGRDASGATHQNTVTVYVMNDSLDDIAKRWNDARFTGPGGGAVSSQNVADLIKNQLRLTPPAGGGTVVDPILISRMDVGGAQPIGFLDNMLSGVMAKDTCVKLWRAVRSPTVEATETTNNLRPNDQLVDRITDPVLYATGTVHPTLERSLPPANTEIAGTFCGPDPEDPAGAGLDPKDNTGFSVAMWASFKRLDNPPDGVAGHIPRGALPAYCIEAPPAWILNLSQFKNIASSQEPMLDVANTMFPSSNADTEYYAAESLNGAANTGTSLYTGIGTNLPNIQTQDKKCENALKGTIREFPEYKNITLPISEQIPSNMAGKAYDAMYAEIALNDRNFENSQTPPVTTLRVADLILPLAVGPMSVPDPAPTAGALIDQDRSWLTLSEAMAVALGYVRPPLSAGFERWRPLRDLADANRPDTDRGNLVLDDFAPFENNDGDTAGTFTVGGDDRRRTPGVPLALSILDHFRTMEPQFGSIAHATPGVVNLNTAPLPVLASLPMLSPARSATGSASTWWGTGATGMNLGVMDGSDLAAGLMAYRDKLQLMDRASTPVVFEDSVMGDDAFAWDGRDLTTAIDGVREARGLASLGEAACVIDQSTAGNRVPEEDRANFLGDDQGAAAGNNGGAGVSSILYKQYPPGTNPDALTEPNEISDDYGEKLAVLSSLGNTASIRSDVFAVWFIVNGYQRSDTEGLQPGDALWPTISRRYVMVVDRSNVTRLGDKPRVLFCTEVPR